MTHAGFFKWDDAADERLRAMAAAQKKRREMAAELGVNIAQIGGRLYRLGLTKPNGRRGQSRKCVNGVADEQPSH